MISCPNCGKDNELGRIFCLKCGAKLDLNAITPPVSAKHKRIRAAQRGVKTAGVDAFFKILKLALLSFSTAFITLIFLPPVMTRYKATVEDGDVFDEKKFQIEEAVNGNQPFSVTFNELEINGMLKKYVKAINNKDKNDIKISGIYASLDENAITVSIDRKWKYFHLFLVCSAKPEVNNGKFIFRPTGGAIGRIPLPEILATHYIALFRPLWKNFESDKTTLDQMTEVNLKPHFITLTRK